MEKISSKLPEHVSSGSRSSIAREDCTLALLLDSVELSHEEEKRVGIRETLEDLKQEESMLSTKLGCKACTAVLELSEFDNIPGSLSCRSEFKEEAKRVLEL